MKKINYFKLIDKTLEFLPLLLLFILPLVFARFYPNVSIFELNKFFWLKVLLYLWLFLLLFKISFLPSAGKNFFSKKFFKSYLFWPSVFILALSLVTLFSLDRTNSFFGLYDRREGLLSHWHYYLFFLLFFYHLFSASDWKRTTKQVLWAMVASGFLVSLYGILQILGIDFVVWSEAPHLTGRTIASLGQPNFLGSFLLLILPLSAYLLFREKNFYLRFFLFLSLGFNLLCLVFTMSRGAWVALLIVLALLILYYVIKGSRRAKALALGSFFVFIIFCLFFFSFNPLFKERIVSSFNFKEGSVAARMFFFKAAVQGFADRPLLGYGLENQELVFYSHYQEDWAVYGFVNALTNRAHNLPLDILLTLGLFGLLLYGALYLFLARHLFKNIKAEGYGLNLALASGLAAYLLSLFFGFSFVVGQVYFWAFFAIVLAWRARQDFGVEYFPPSGLICGLKKIPGKVIKKFLYLELALIVLAVLALGQFKVLIADHYFFKMRYSFYVKDYYGALTFYERIKDAGVYDAPYSIMFVKNVYDYFFNFQDPDLIEANRALVQEVKDDLPETLNHNRLMALAKAEAILGNYEKSQEYFDRLIQASPLLPENYDSLAKMLRAKGDLAGAALNYEKIIDLVPGWDDERLNDDHEKNVRSYLHYVWQNLGEVRLAQGDYQGARQAFQESLRMVFDLSIYKKIADTYFMEANYDRAVFYLERGAFLSNKDYLWPWALATLYQSSGDEAKSLEAAQKALELSPGNKEIQKFITNLKNK